MNRHACDWNCPNCNIRIFGSKPACFKCGATRHSRTATANNAAPTPSVKRPDWNCPKCGMLVFGSKPACFKCGVPNPATTNNPATAPVSQPATAFGRAPDWFCATCKITVFGSKPSCFKCGAPNPASAASARVPAASVLPGGDWQCPSCAFVVFATKGACPKCAAPRPGSTATKAADAAALAEREAVLKAREAELEQRLAGAAATDILAAVPPPVAWGPGAAGTGCAMGTNTFTLEPITDPDQVACITALVAVSASDKSAIKNLGITNVWRVKNHKLWVQYGTLRQLFCADAKKPLAYTPRTSQHLAARPMPSSEDACGLTASALASRANEAFLFHGTKHDIAPIIAEQGFDERVASLGGLFGGGVYFADDFVKSNAYAGLDAKKKTRVMFVSRVLLGNMTDVRQSRSMQSQARRAPDGFDTVCGRTNAHEFIVYDRRQTYPEFLFEYAL